jgi:hypothetical protein
MYLCTCILGWRNEEGIMVYHELFIGLLIDILSVRNPFSFEMNVVAYLHKGYTDAEGVCHDLPQGTLQLQHFLIQHRTSPRYVPCGTEPRSLL